MASRTAAKLICRNLLAALRRNEQGVAEDIDIEFLHDFRVAARRVRSVFALLGDALEPDVRSRFSAAFKELGKMSGIVRDLDVQRLAAAESRARLPEMLHDGLDSLFAELAAKRAAAQQALAVWLTAPQQQDMLRAWEEYLEQEDAEGGRKMIGKAAGKIINHNRHIQKAMLVDQSQTFCAVRMKHFIAAENVPREEIFSDDVHLDYAGLGFQRPFQNRPGGIAQVNYCRTAVDHAF